jgi:hypothetical protein
MEVDAGRASSILIGCRKSGTGPSPELASTPCGAMPGGRQASVLQAPLAWAAIQGTAGTRRHTAVPSRRCVARRHGPTCCESTFAPISVPGCIVYLTLTPNGCSGAGGRWTCRLAECSLDSASLQQTCRVLGGRWRGARVGAVARCALFSVRRSGAAAFRLLLSGLFVLS